MQENKQAYQAMKEDLQLKQSNQNNMSNVKFLYEIYQNENIQTKNDNDDYKNINELSQLFFHLPPNPDQKKSQSNYEQLLFKQFLSPKNKTKIHNLSKYHQQQQLINQKQFIEDIKIQEKINLQVQNNKSKQREKPFEKNSIYKGQNSQNQNTIEKQQLYQQEYQEEDSYELENDGLNKNNILKHIYYNFSNLTTNKDLKKYLTELNKKLSEKHEGYQKYLQEKIKVLEKIAQQTKKLNKTGLSYKSNTYNPK
ncbi:hypothetical protein PPERSA_11792 [Pseudocohnilembus persalinus]|uniref:Uncharacterized protein n=1 Tax=Pseudocohnilembus persalinus TaxID=266149 RepID=A0A0V0QRT4_PSEPJ|nr:hypothetical protein PPERSA_11792 [Pseudocohnilembus persalinus]|eukprot:KRX04736.1 hypothetical protein PPERSA_11792 [Pseudocohnilembus persalinus]